MINKYKSRLRNDLKEVCKVGQDSGWFDSNVRWQVGFESKIKLWDDVWVGNNQLNIRFPRIYRNSHFTEKPLNMFGRWPSRGCVWELK